MGRLGDLARQDYEKAKKKQISKNTAVTAPKTTTPKTTTPETKRVRLGDLARQDYEGELARQYAAGKTTSSGASRQLPREGKPEMPAAPKGAHVTPTAITYQERQQAKMADPGARTRTINVTWGHTKAELDEAKKRLEAARAEARRVDEPYAVTRNNANTPRAKEAEERARLRRQAVTDAKKKVDELELRLSQVSGLRYEDQNERALQRTKVDPATGKAYVRAKEALADKGKLESVLKWRSSPSSGWNAEEVTRFQQYEADLRRDYGLTENDLLAYAQGDDTGVQRVGQQIDTAIQGAQEAGEGQGMDFRQMDAYERRKQSQEEAQKRREEYAKFAKDHPVFSTIASVASIPASMFQGADIVNMDWGRGDPGDPDYIPPDTSRMKLTDALSTTRGAVAQNIRGDGESLGRNFLSFLYETGMSAADSASTVAMLGPGALPLMGANAAVNQSKNIIDRGGTREQAILGGLASGAAEVFFEKFSVDQLLKPKDITGWKSFVKEGLKQGGVEASEEMATEIANIFSDTAIMGANSDFQNAVRDYMADGMSEEQAKQRAYLDQVGQVVRSGFGGFLSGGMTSTVYNAPAAIGNAVETHRQKAAAQKAETGAAPAAGKYRATRPKNVEMPTVPIINLSVSDISSSSPTMKTGNSLRADAIGRARKRLGLDKNSAAYIPASNVTRDGNEYVLKITKASLNKMLSTREGDTLSIKSIAVMDNLERIANNGVWFDGEGDRKSRPQIAGFDHLKTTVYIDNVPHLVDMRVKLVEEVPGKGTDNVLYYFTPEEILSIEEVGTKSPTGERHAFTMTSETVPTSKDTVTQTQPGVNPVGGVDAMPQTEREVIARYAQTSETLGEMGRDVIGTMFEDGQDGETYVTHMRTVYQTGRDGQRLDSLDPSAVRGLTDDQVLAAYTAGVEDAAQAETTAIDTDPEGHSPEQQAEIARYLKSTDERLRKVFEDRKSGVRTGFFRENISPVTQRQAEDVQRLLGGEYSGYTNAINANGVDHILKDHGPEGRADHSMADFNDIARMGYVLAEYDSVEVVTYKSGEADLSREFMTKDNRPAQMLRYSKRVDGTYYVVEAIPESKYKKLWVVSAYMQKADGGTQAPNAHGPETTPKAPLASSPSATDIVRQTPRGVNPAGAVDTTSQSPAANSQALGNLDEEQAWTQKGETQDEQAGTVRVREGGLRADGAGAALEAGAVAEGTVAALPRADRRGPADAGAGALQVGGKISSYELGVATGVRGDTLYRVTGGTTEDVTEMRRLAATRGLDVVVFAGGNLHVRVYDRAGKPTVVEARAYINGNKLYVRADHADFTALQLYRHEEYHDRESHGEVDTRQTMEAVRETLGDELTAKLEAMYSRATGGLEGLELWEEIAADQYAGMNVFSGAFGAEDIETLQTQVGAQTDAQLAAKTETAAATARRTGPPEGKASIEPPALQNAQDGGTMDTSPVTEDMTEDETAALLDYKSSWSYKINSMLRDGKTLDPATRRKVEALDRAIQKLPVYQGTVYRRLSFDMEGSDALETFLVEHQPGGIVDYPAFTSGAKTLDGYLVMGELTVTMVIDGVNGHDAEGIGNNFEREVLFARASIFIVDRVETDTNGKPVIYAREVTENGTGQLHSQKRGETVQQVQEAGELHSDLPEVSQDDSARGSGGRRLPGVRAEGARGDALGLTLQEGETSREGDQAFIQELRDLQHDVDVGTLTVETARERLDAMIGEYGAIKSGENPAREIAVPRRTAKDKKVSQTVRTILEAEATPDVAVPTLEELTANGEFSYEVYTDKAAIERAKQTIQYKGWGTSLAEWFKDVQSGTVSKDNTALGWALYNNAVNRKDPQTAMDIINAMIRHQRNAGQAIQATRILKKMSPETQLYAAQRSVENLQAEIDKKYRGKKNTKITIDEELAKRLLEAKDQDARDEALKDIYRDVGRQLPSTFMDKWNAWRYLAMLGNPRTHVRNTFGNLGFAPVVLVKDQVATVIEKAVHTVSRGRLERSKGFVGAGKTSRGLLAAAWGDYARVQETAMAGGKYGDFQQANRYIEEGKIVYKSKPGKVLEAARRANSTALDAEDMLFSKSHYVYAMAQYCAANGITEEMIRAGDSKTLARAREYAIQEAQKATYRDANVLSQAFGSLGGNLRRSKYVAVRGLGMAVEGILPFRKTPANILARGLEYSPLGLMKGITYDAVQVRRGELSGAEMIDHISAGLTGTGLLALGVFLASMGILRGRGPGDDKEREMDKLQGHQDYALEIGNVSITLDWLAPEVLPLFIGVNLWETAQTEGDVTMADMLGALKNVSDPLLEMSCLQSLNDIFESVGYASQNEMNPLAAMLVSAATSYITQGLPTIFGQGERVFVETQRETTYTEKDAFLTGDMQYFLGKSSGKIPGWEYQQIPHVDAWGRIESTGGIGQRAFNNFLNPAYVSDVESSAMEKELERLYEATGDGGVFPKRASKYFQVDGKRKDLTAEEYVTYATKKGQAARKVAETLTRSKLYNGLEDSEKAEAVQDAYKYADQVARQMVAKKYEPDSWVVKAQTAKKYGIPVEDYIILRQKTREIESIEGEDGKPVENSKSLQIMEVVYDAPGLNDKQRRYLFEAFGVGKTVLHYNKLKVQEKLKHMR